MKIADRVVTVSDYKQAFEMGMAAYPIKVLTDPEHIKVAKVRLLNQMSDELVIIKRADDLKLTVLDDELNIAINNIIKDYPDQTFDQILVEQSISFSRWRESLRKRLLIEKTIRKDTGYFSEPALDSKTPVEANQEQKNEKENPTDPEEKAVEGEKNIESSSARDVYAAWMAGLRRTYPVSIDENQWEILLKE